ncbi:ATPase, F1/V1/A1 complex, alpha/beta subunit [Tanacetum coccineum]
MDGLDAILENGPWFIRNNPLILRKWYPNDNLLKEYVSTIPVWVKLHGVPVTAFSEDGLSDIATKLEQYFLMTDYSPWEVILNGNKVLKRTVGETEQECEPTTAEEKHD